MASHFSGFALVLLLSFGAVARAVPLLNEQTMRGWRERSPKLDIIIIPPAD